MRKLYFSFHIIIFLSLIPFLTNGQEQWMVYFRDKQRCDFNPNTYFDTKAIERRIHHNLPLDDISDWPVDENYIQQVTMLVNDVVMTSRWLNSVVVVADNKQISDIRNLPFVADIEQVNPALAEISEFADFDISLGEYQADLLKAQLHTLGSEAWKKAGLDGKGLRIAIFDVGFEGADKIPVFDHIRKENRLIATRDFTSRKQGENVYYGNIHGTEVWSCIAGKIDSLQIGLATGAEFLLAKTEVNSEKFSEELNWLAAAEWADKNGADIINSSLGYTGKRYFNWQMDGKTAFVTRAANMAAAKGILVVNAAGNEGSDKWRFIGAPADADSVLSVGGIDPATGFHTSFSSYGPTSDKRMKPNVSAYGHVVAAAPPGLTSTQGTSFSSPLIAGFAACAWQNNRSLTNMELFHEIEKSASLYPYFDYAHGYGVPQAKYFLNKEKTIPEPTFRVIESGDSINIIVDKNFINLNSSQADNEIRRSYFVNVKPADDQYYFYYNIMNSKGKLDSYFVLNVTQPEVLTILKSDFTENETLNLSYKGYTMSIKL